MANQTMKGTVIKVNKGKDMKGKDMPHPHSYIVEGDDADKTTYLVHVGDIQENEDLLYQLYNENKVTKLQMGDSVEFEPEKTSDLAIHVKKIS